MGLITSRQTQKICVTFAQCWTNVKDVGPTLYKCYTNVLCLLGCRLLFRDFLTSITTLNVLLFIYLFAIHSTCTYQYIRVHKQIVQYSRLSENRQYTYTSSETIVIKLKLY